MVSDFLQVAIIQTSLDAEAAWCGEVSDPWQNFVKMSYLEERRAKKEIRHYLASLRGQNKQADIILLPELSVPISYEKRLAKAAEKLNSIIIAGLDYKIIGSEPVPTVSNEAVIIVPRKLKNKKISRRTEIRRIGKTYAAPGEQEKLKNISPSVTFKEIPEVWLFDGDDLGKFAVAICYDFMDLDRIVLYRGKIQTLFILAYNRDTNSFDHLAEAIARMVFCNVVVCNCGHFGGSVSVSPFREPFLRTVYRHSGIKLPNIQIVSLPLKSLIEHTKVPDKVFKSLPPGYSRALKLAKKSQKIST